jgi:hypothetical protein
MQTEAEKRLTNRNIPGTKDLTGSQNHPEPVEPVDQDEGTVEDIVNDHRLSTAGGDVDPYEGEKEDISEEVEITHLRHPKTGIVFPVNDAIIKQKHLRPCDEKGKLVHDSRIFNRFN